MAKRKKRRKRTPKSNQTYELLVKDLNKEVPQQRVITSLSRGQREKIDQYLNLRITPVCWGIPCDEVMYTKFFTMFIRQGAMPWDDFATSESTYLPEARNEIHNNFVNDSVAPYLMMQDSDIMAPPGIVNRLLSHNKHIVGGWYKNKNYFVDAHPIVYDYGTVDPNHFSAREKPGKGMEKVAGMGAGCWLMSRELAEALGNKPYSMEQGGEDLWISKKIMELGYEMWVDWDLALAHIGIAWV